eukprot:566379-Hanusia_phi.AAC.3
MADIWTHDSALEDVLEGAKGRMLLPWQRPPAAQRRAWPLCLYHLRTSSPLLPFIIPLMTRIMPTSPIPRSTVG